MTIDSERMLLLNTRQKPESLFFGKGFFDGKVRLEGFTKNLNITLVGSTERDFYKNTMDRKLWFIGYFLC